MIFTPQLPKSRAEIAAIQSARKRIAFSRAQALPWYRGKLDHVDASRLDEPEEWEKIPILDKEVLRELDHQQLMRQFCAVAPRQVAEYWRSGGSTGRPVFYPRTYNDIRCAQVSWGRSFQCMQIGAGDLCHLSFPLGMHPAGQVWARSALEAGVGMTWVGAGNALPSAAQLELITTLRPSVFMGMGSFALHLANLADALGMDLANGSVAKVVCSAESLSQAKRSKIEQMWGAEVFDVFGMSEAGLMGAESAAHDGLHVWTDHYIIEVVDRASNRAVPEGEVGSLCVTPLWCNEATPFLRWDSGDLVTLTSRGQGDSIFAELYPMIRHTNRTTGFFKVRGVNVGQTELEDLLWTHSIVSDFQAVLESNEQHGLEQLRVRVEFKRGSVAAEGSELLRNAIKHRFEFSAQIEAIEPGTLAKEFQSGVKAPRFVDNRMQKG